MARFRNQTTAPSESQQASKRTTRATRVALKEKTNITRSLRYPNDGDTEALVKDAKPRRGRPPKVISHRDGDFLMTGAIGGLTSQEVSTSGSTVATSTDPIARGDVPTHAKTSTTTRKRKRGRPKEESEQDEEFDEIIVSTSDATAKSHQVDSMTTATTSVLPEGGSSSALKSANETTMVHSSLNLAPSSPPVSGLEPIGNELQRRNSVAQPGSALRNPGTPAFESSMLLRNFRRRPRQPSMLAMVQQHQQALNARTSNVGVEVSHLDMDEIEGQDTTFGVVAGLDSDEDVEEFTPEAEGTPLQHTRTKPALQNTNDTSKPKAQRRKRPSSDTVDTSGALAALRAKRRRSQPKSGDAPEHAHQDTESDRLSQRLPSSPPHHEINENELGSDIQVMRSSPVIQVPSSPQRPDKLAAQRSLARDDSANVNEIAIPSTDPQSGNADRHGRAATVSANIGQVKPAGVDDTMAEPVSSSPSRAGFQTEEDIMAYPLTQPTQQSPRQVKRKKPPKSLGTATLQSLLPQQRRVLHPRIRRTEYDLESSDIADFEGDSATIETDSDENRSAFGSRRRAAPRRTKTGTQKTRPRVVSPAKSKKGQTRKATPSSRQLSKGATAVEFAPEASKRLGRKAGRTYSKVTTSDKENDELYQSSSEAEAEESVLPDVSITSVEAAKSRELEDAKRKFAEIDQWDGLEFENLDSEDHRSSSQGWR